MLVVGALAIALARIDTSNVPRLVTVSLTYGVVYLAFLVVTVSLFDAATPINDRLLVPLGPAVAFAIAWVTSRSPILAAIVICCFALATAQHVRTVSLYGLDYSAASGSPRVWTGFDCLTACSIRTGPVPSPISRGSPHDGYRRNVTRTPSTPIQRSPHRPSR